MGLFYGCCFRVCLGSGVRMKVIALLMLVSVAGCSSVPTCATKSVSVKMPASIPLLGTAPFVFERSNTHVDCERDPEERELPAND